MPENSTRRRGAETEEVMEDVPMCRFSNPIPACEHKHSRGSCDSPCSHEEQLEQILAALACQNQLLVDLLGAVNCLTAAMLANHAT